MLKVLVYHPWIYLKGGAEKVLLEYTKHTKYKSSIHGGYLGDDTYEELKAKTTITASLLGKVTVKRTIWHSFKSLLAIFVSKLSNKKSDVLLISSEGLGDFVELFRRKSADTTIAYVHTPLKLVYDEDSLASTKKRLGRISFSFFVYFIKPLYKIVNRWVWRRYDYVIANSTETRRRIIEGKLINPEKIAIIFPGADLVDQNCLYSFEEKYAGHQYLIAGRIMIQKNIEMGIQAFIDANLDQALLVIAGHCDNKSQTYLSELITRYQSNRIIFKPNPTDSEYHQLFEASKCLIFTPTNEEWGIVPVESMAYGVPVICANKGGPSESVIDGQTGILCGTNAQSFSNAIIEFDAISLKQYERYSLASKQRAEMFTWKTFAEKIDKIIEQTYNNKQK